MFPRSFMNFDSDPFFSAHQQHMRQMDRMMGVHGFGAFGGFGSPSGMLEGPPDHRNGERAMVPRQEPFMSGFDSMFRNMNSMMSGMHRNFNNMASNPNGYSYSSSQVMSYSNDGTGQPKYFEASSSTKTAPGGVKETQKTVRDSESGVHKMAVGHHIGDRAHVIEKSKNLRTESEEQKQDFFNMDEANAGEFDREWKDKTRSFHNGISGFNDGRRRNGGENRRTTPALENGAHREREGRERHHAGRERPHAGHERPHAGHERHQPGAENRRSKKEKKVRMADGGSHL